ncbi:pilus assembly protein [Rhodococcus aerolatus]
MSPHRGGLTARWASLTERPEHGGAPTTEAAQLLPVVLLVLVAVIAGGRVSNAHDAADQAARAAARIASVGREPVSARADATAAATASFEQQNVHCLGVNVDVSTAGLTAALGTSGAVTTTVKCTVALSELAFPGIPGDRTLTASFTSLVDPNRERP